MERLREIMRSQAAFCGLEVLTYCFLANHFHIFVRLDPRVTEEMDDAELLRRFRALYGSKRCASLGVDADRLAAVLQLDGAAAVGLRRRLRARMGQASVFMRELKTRFTLWYNSRHGTVGTFWAERFRSVLVEAGSRAEKLVAAYIDLNAVRAGLVREADAYGFCGYGEACAGNPSARKGIARLEGAVAWTSGVRERYGARLRAGDRRTRKASGEDGASGDSSLARQTGGAGQRSLLTKSRVFSEGGALGTLGWVLGFTPRADASEAKEGRKPASIRVEGFGLESDLAAIRSR